MTVSARAILFICIVVASIAGVSLYLRQNLGRREAAAAAPEVPAARVGVDRTLLESGVPLLVFRKTTLDAQNGSLAVAALSDPSSIQIVPDLRCERVHMAGGRGICLVADRGMFTTYRAILFDREFRATKELPLGGVPSRTQVAPNGRLAATTVFVSGHSYAAGGFSTRSSIVDLETGQWLIEDLETLTVRRAGQVLQAIDFNFWGVTFTRDSRHFYATLGTGGETHLVRGDLETRAIEVMEEQVECPSISPDNRRLVFKQRSGGVVGGVAWRLWVLDLETKQRHPVAEARNVDDQAQWLDDERILYALPTEGRAASMDQWVVASDGSGTPVKLISEAYSAGVVRPRE